MPQHSDVSSLYGQPVAATILDDTPSCEALHQCPSTAANTV